MKGVGSKRVLRSGYAKVFLLCLLTSAVMFLPSLIVNKGLFSLVGDFNYQQIPFNILSNRAVKSGDIFWNWYTDLGSNFIGSYSFYTIGSPFFWLSLLFPPYFFPYVVGPMFMLKYCTAGLTSYAYIRRYVQDDNYAVIGALLYAFSGFTAVNLMFNHFHDVVAFFPLLLVGLDRLVLEKKRTGFALAVALNAALNFFFFAGEAIFLLLYYCVRFLAEDFRAAIRRLPAVLWEAVLGVGASCVIFLPAVLFTLQNPRLDSFLYGPSALVFDGSRYLEIIKAFLMPADIMPHQSAIYPSDFTSSGAYLPLFGIVGAAAFMIRWRKNWASRLVRLLVVMACVPLLNSLFYLLNSSYYARWFYMPVLLLALMTAVVLEHRVEADRELKKGLLATTGAAGLLVLFLLFYPWSESERSAVFHLDIFLIYVAMTVLGLIAVYYLIVHRFRSGQWLPAATTAVVLFAAIPGLFNITAIHSIYNYQAPKQTYDNVVRTGQLMKETLPKRQDYRVSISDGGWNLPMVSGLPTVNSFTSMVNGSIFQFYRSIGSPRDVKTIIPEPMYGLKVLLSERFSMDTKLRSDRKLYTEFFNGTSMVYLYENKNIPPIGFTYDYYMTKRQFRSISTEFRHLALLKAVVLSNSEIRSVKNRLVRIPDSELGALDDSSYKKDVAARRAESSLSFRHDNHGFTSVIRSYADKYAFFSVPYDRGWSATVNGRRVHILNADGMMIVPVNEGKNTIRFTYRTPGLTAGIVVSLLSLVALALTSSPQIRRLLRRRAERSHFPMGSGRRIN
ncbi:MAG: YfhO family protein [Sporolactobacillus sp.]|jgi:uncharacterized membrane protein YfhO|nr:YfhO family protein [Sporolactobacillus sp.]